MPKTPLRIGTGAAFSGDRIDPALVLAERGELDFHVFECLAERTIALAQLRTAQGLEQGLRSAVRAANGRIAAAA